MYDANSPSRSWNNLRRLAPITKKIERVSMQKRLPRLTLVRKHGPVAFLLLLGFIYLRKTMQLLNLDIPPPASFYLWSADFHVAPVACNAQIYEEAGGYVHAEVDFPNCIFYPRFCAKRLKVLAHDNWRGFSLDPCPNQLRKRFFQAYQYDAEFQRVGKYSSITCDYRVFGYTVPISG